MHLMILQFAFLFVIIPPSYSKCLSSYPCRNFSLEFPFTDSKDPDCGFFQVHHCSNASSSDHPRVGIGSEGSFYEILGKASTNNLLVRDPVIHSALANRKCFSFSNMSLLHQPSVSFTFSPNLTFFTCYKDNAMEGIEKSFHNYRKVECEISTVFYKPPAKARVAASGETRAPSGCAVTQLPLKSENSSGDLFDMLSADFSLEWSVSEECNECYHGGGLCLADNQNKFFCKQAVTGNMLQTRLCFVDQNA